MKKRIGILITMVAGMMLLSCNPAGRQAARETPSQEGKAVPQETAAAPQEPEGAAVGEKTPEGSPAPVKTAEPAYAYINPEGQALEARINAPQNYSRTKAPEGSFAAFVRNYPMKPDASPVLLYDGTEKRNQDAHEAVFAMHLEPRDLQQCADSVMRIYAEYLYQKGESSKISFHLVNGFSFGFDTWSQGHKLLVDGNKTSWGADLANDGSEESFERYLIILFAYASTLSMEQESKAIKASDLQTGDIFIKGGSPGHVVMIADICENAQGERAFLLAQGYMPAQEFHVLKNPLHDEDPWYYASELAYPFRTPEYSFGEESLQHPPYLDDAAEE